MKKIISVLLVLLMTLSLCGCEESEAPAATPAPEASEAPAPGTSPEQEPSGEPEGSAIEVDDGLLFVEVTLPASLFTDESPEEIIAEAEKNGYSGCTVHEDGSVTYKMSKEVHEKMMAEIRTALSSTIESLTGGEDAVASFLKIEHTEDFSLFDIHVDPETYSGWESLYVLVFYTAGAAYQAFDGRAAETIDVTVNFIDSVSGETIDSGSFRDLIASIESVF